MPDDVAAVELQHADGFNLPEPLPGSFQVLPLDTWWWWWCTMPDMVVLPFSKRRKDVP